MRNNNLFGDDDTDPDENDDDDFDLCPNDDMNF